MMFVFYDFENEDLKNYKIINNEQYILLKQRFNNYYYCDFFKNDDKDNSFLIFAEVNYIVFVLKKEKKHELLFNFINLMQFPKKIKNCLDKIIEKENILEIKI
jgi:hypothetical protein